MKTVQSIFTLLLLLTGFSSHAETDNFNVSLTGTLDNTAPDYCTVTPLSTVDLGTLNMHDIAANANSYNQMGFDFYETGVSVDIIVNCTNGTKYKLGYDTHSFDALSYFILHNGTGFLNSNMSSTGNGINQIHTYNIVFTSLTSDITDLTGALSATIPLTLTVL